MADKYLQTMNQAIGQIALFAHMNIEEASEFIYLYLDSQINGQNHQKLHDENMEGVFTQTAQALQIPVAELKTKIYGLLSQQNSHRP